MISPSGGSGFSDAEITILTLVFDSYDKWYYPIADAGTYLWIAGYYTVGLIMAIWAITKIADKMEIGPCLACRCGQWIAILMLFLLIMVMP